MSGRWIQRLVAACASGFCWCLEDLLQISFLWDFVCRTSCVGPLLGLHFSHFSPHWTCLCTCASTGCFCVVHFPSLKWTYWLNPEPGVRRRIHVCYLLSLLFVVFMHMKSHCQDRVVEWFNLLKYVTKYCFMILGDVTSGWGWFSYLKLSTLNYITHLCGPLNPCMLCEIFVYFSPQVIYFWSPPFPSLVEILTQCYFPRAGGPGASP